MGIDLTGPADELAAFLNHSGLSLLVLAIGALIALELVTPLVHRIVVRLIQRRNAEDEFGLLAVDDTTRRIETVETVIVRTLRLVIVVLFVLFVLTVLDLIPVIAGFGLLAAALTVAGQEVVRDYLMGLLIVAEGQYSKGDVVKLGGLEGAVEEVSLRRTVLRDYSGTVHSISNGEIRSSSNMTRHYARILVEVTVAFGTDLERVSEIVAGVGAHMFEEPQWSGALLEPPTVMRVAAFTELGVPLVIGGRVRAAERFDATVELRKRVLAALQEHGIEIPGVHRLVPTPRG